MHLHMYLGFEIPYKGREEARELKYWDYAERLIYGYCI